MTNELQVAETVNNEVVAGNQSAGLIEAIERIVEERDGMVIVQNKKTGKFARRAIYKPFTSVVAETRAEKVEMLKLLNSDEIAQPLKEHIGAHIPVQDVIFQPYDKVNEDTGALEFGVLTYLLTPEKVAYVTSSKSVYHSMKSIMDVFGEPSWKGDDVLPVKAVLKKGQQHQYTDITLV